LPAGVAPTSSAQTGHVTTISFTMHIPPASKPHRGMRH
jgi:hypothetical protein